MLKALREVRLAYYIQHLENPKVMRSHLPEIKTYKLGLAAIYETLFNSFVEEVNNPRYTELIALTYYWWKRENDRSECDLDLLPAFINILRKDMTERVKLESMTRTFNLGSD